MNKKEYINPDMEVVKINAPQLLAGSIEVGEPGSADGAESPDFNLDREVFGF